MTEPFAIPASWQWVTFSDVARVASNLVSPLEYPDLPHIAPNHIESETGRLLPYKTAAEDGVTSSKHLFEPGHILYSKIRPYLAKVVRVDFRGVCSADMYPIEASIDSRYLFWWLLTPTFTSLAAGHQSRVVLPKINKEALGKLPVPVPPLAEQRRIVAALEDHLSRLDKARQLAATARKRLDHLRASLISARLGSMDAPRFRLGDVATIASGHTPKGVSDYLKPQPGAGMIPYYKVGDMNLVAGRYMSESRTYLSSEDAASLKLHVRPAGTVLIPKRGGAIHTNKKRIMQTAAAYDLNTMGIVPSEKLDPVYLWYWFEQLDLSSIADGSNVPQINKPDLVDLVIPIPELGRQKEIASALDEAMGGIQRIADIPVIARASSLHRALLAEAFAGRLVAQDPADEPASVLLERIRSERAARGPVRRGRRSKGQEAVL